MRVKSLCISILVLSLNVQGQTSSKQPRNITGAKAETAVEHPAFSGDLVKALIFAGQTFNVSIVAELAQPYPTKISVPAGNHDAFSYLLIVTRTLRNYRTEKRDGVYWIYDVRLLRAKGDYLNGMVPEFRTPPTLGDFETFFPMYISVAEGRGGGVIGGLAARADDSIKLRPDRLKNVRLRDALFSVSRQVQGLFALFLFPNSTVPNWHEGERAYTILQTIKSVLANPPHFRSLPATHAPK